MIEISEAGAQTKRIITVVVLAILFILALYIATLGNWIIGIDEEYLGNLDDAILGYIPILMVVIWMKIFADLFLCYYIGRSFKESLGIIEKAIPDTNWFLKPAIKNAILCIILQLGLIILTPLDYDKFDNFEIIFDDFFKPVILQTMLIIQVVILIITVALFFFTKVHEEVPE